LGAKALTDIDPAFASGKPRQINWTCIYPDCNRPFKAWTRRGLRITCRHCGRVQEGPEGIRRVLEARKAKPSKPVTTLKIVATPVKPKAKAAPKPASKPTPKAVPRPAAPQPQPRDAIARLMGF
jgi:hypothetical protein